jgi:hypothetical protein
MQQNQEVWEPHGGILLTLHLGSREVGRGVEGVGCTKPRPREASKGTNLPSEKISQSNIPYDQTSLLIV